MGNDRKTQITVLDANVTHDKLPKDFALAVKDIKLAILQARAKAARLANAEALKLYFFVGGYISKKTRNAKWGSGAIDALSNRLQVELPGLRGFSAMSIRYMRLFFEAWSPCAEIQHLASVGFGGVAFQHLSSVESHYLTSNEFGSTQNRQLPTAEIRPMPLGDLDKDDIAAFFSIGLLLCEEMKKPVVQLAVQDVSKPIGVATYKTLRSIPQPYKTLAPVIEGVRRVMANARAESDLKPKKKSAPRKTAKGGK